jgi:hypothetical protein
MNQFYKSLFYSGVLFISIFEILNVYFIMPMPGSQEIKSIDIAYFLYSHRWIFRVVAGLMIALGSLSVFRSIHKWVPSVILLISIFIIYIFNFRLTAENMFLQPGKLVFKNFTENHLNKNSLVIGVENNGQVKGYPIQFLAYHHQVQDTVGGKPLIITYCSVCRTGRVYEPLVKGHFEKFRLVGMDHYNAMFEDETTKSWWRQVNGEAITGFLKGQMLPEAESMQLTVSKLFELYPNALIMQEDKASKMRYDSLRKFEQGYSKGSLTRTDSISWNKKSWVIGVTMDSINKVYDWNQLKDLHIINDNIGASPIILALSSDEKSFAAFERPVATEIFSIKDDTLYSNGLQYNFSGNCLNNPSQKLKRINAYQEFWHSWKTFHPNTQRYQ